ncbi:MAG: M15 family metallopeptidase [Candidatus Pacebacteria bacterium]|nr:M15 family metallopeptidase [Candidatus Paceibacterota bacterium]
MKTKKETKKYKFISIFKNVFFHKVIFIFFAFLCFSNTVYALGINGSPKVEESRVTINVQVTATTRDEDINYKVYKLDAVGKRSSINSVLSGKFYPDLKDLTSLMSFDLPINGVESLIRNSLYQIEIEGRELDLDGINTYKAVVNFKTVATDTRVGGSGNWYYASALELSDYFDTNRSKSFHRFSSEDACTLAHDTAVFNMYADKTKATSFSICFEQTIIPTKTDFTLRMQAYGVAWTTKKDMFFYTGYKESDKKWSRSKAFESLALCQSSEKSDPALIIIDSCEKSSSPPAKPVGWTASGIVAGDTSSNNCIVDKANFYPYGKTGDTFYKEGSTKVSIVIQTVNCANKELQLTVKEMDSCPASSIPNFNCNNALSSSGLENKTIIMPATEAVTLNYIAGEEECETIGSGLIDISDGYDCLYYFELATPDGEKWSSVDRVGGRIYYECVGACDEDWEQSGSQEDTVDPGAINPRIANDEYNLLAPIGEIKSIDNTKQLGDYINLIVKIFLGICGALAVIMIVIYGIQWMGSESIFAKTESKQKIGGALMGLVLALGSWMLLNTINPDLLGGELNIGQANIEVEEDAMSENDALPPLGTAVARCPEGIYQVQTAGGSFPVCKTMQDNLKKMIDLAWSQNIKITGFGFRSKTRQEELRAQNCGAANVYKQNARCKPDTAIPGTSMHESGLAFDFRCEGSKIATKDNKCFLWLKANASKYNLKNLSSEPWHWSTTGH